MLAFLRQTDQRHIGLLFAFASMLCTGSYNALAKGLTPLLSPGSLLVISEALTAFFVVMSFGMVPLIKLLAKMDMKTVSVCVLIGLLNSALAPLLWFQGLSMTTAVNASILSPTGLIASLLVSRWLLDERITRTQAMGAATILAGVLVINLTAAGPLKINPGDVLIVIATQLTAVGSVLFKKYLTHVMPELAIAIRNVTGIVVVLLVSSRFPSVLTVGDISVFPMQLIWGLLAFVFFARYLNLAFYYEALDRLPATTVSLIDIATPLFGMAFAVLLLGESIGASHLFGGTFIVMGLLLEQLSETSLHQFQSAHWPLQFLRRRHLMDQMVLKVGKQV